MKTKVFNYLICIICCFITLMIIIFNTQIKVHSICQLYVNDRETILLINDNNVLEEIKSFNYFLLENTKTKQQTKFYVKNNAYLNSENLVLLQNNYDYSYNNGWHEVLLYVKSESFASYYLGL